MYKKKHFNLLRTEIKLDWWGFSTKIKISRLLIWLILKDTHWCIWYASKT